MRSIARWATGIGSAAVLAVSATLAVMGPAAAVTGPRVASPEQAGYAVTGGQFRYVQATVYLRQPAGYAAQLASFGDSVQLWSSGRTVTLGVSDVTSGSSPYSPALAAFDHSGPAPGDLVFSGNSQFTGADNIPAGHTVTLSLFYDMSAGVVTATVYDPATDHAGVAHYDIGTGVKFTQARIGNEVGCYAPWDPKVVNGCGSAVTAPAASTKLASFTGAQVTTYTGHHGTLADWYAHAKVDMTSDGTTAGTPNATASDLGDGGASFSVSLTP